jgi:hypothetical protein
MKWFFALNERGNDFENYAAMLKVAVFTAQKSTSLKPHFLYDGAENHLTEWLRRRNVQIIHRRTFFYDKLKFIAEKRGDPNFLGIGAGAFLRTEIPRLSLELGFADEFVLYTDLDVMFCADVVATLKRFKPRFFAVAPEYHKNNYKRMNTGVMLMNLPALRECDAEFQQFIGEKIDLLVERQWDQGAYQIFFKNKFWAFRWDKLPLELNWKPYWNVNAAAQIVHFHGPKPTQYAALTSDNPPEHLKILLPLAAGGYRSYSETWRERLREAASSEI